MTHTGSRTAAPPSAIRTRRISALAVSGVLSLALPCAAQAQSALALPVPPNTSIALSGGYAGTTITAAGEATTATVNNGSAAVFQAATQISLKPGFHAQQGSSFHAYLAPLPAPSFSVLVEPEWPLYPSNNTQTDITLAYDITIYGVQGFSGPVSILPQGYCTGSLNLREANTFNPPGSPERTYWVGPGSSVTTRLTVKPQRVAIMQPGYYGLKFLAYWSNVQREFCVGIQVPVAPDFTVYLSDSSTVLPQNQATYEATVFPINSFADQVQLSISGLPAGSTFSPTAVTPSTTSFPLTISMPQSTGGGSYPIFLTGTSGTKTHSSPRAYLNVTGFSLTPAPTSATIERGSSAQFTIGAAPFHGFSGDVTFGVSNLPSGVTASFNPTSGSSSVLTLTAGAGVTAGDATVTVTGTATFSGVVLSAATPIALHLTTPDQTVQTVPTGRLVSGDGDTASAAPRTFTWTTGSSHTISVAATQTNGTTRHKFLHWEDSTTNPSRTVTASAGAVYTATFQTQHQITASATTGGTVTISEPTESGGWYNANAQVTITATPATGYRFVGFTGAYSGSTSPLTVSATTGGNVAASFRNVGVTLSAPAVSVAPGQTVNASVTITPESAYSGSVGLSLACTPPGLTVTLPGSISVSGTPVTVSVPVTAAAGLAGGPYALSLSAADGEGPLASTTLTVNVSGWTREYVRLGGRVIAVENPPAVCGRQQ